MNFLPLVPAALMLLAIPVVGSLRGRLGALWTTLTGLSLVATLAATASVALELSRNAHAGSEPGPMPWLRSDLLSAWLALLVQGIGTVIAGFSSRYLEGERNQPGYAAALAGVLAAVQLLLLADHWLVLIGAWAAVGIVLNQLLCFYSDRPFAALAAHKKFIADRLADVLLIAAAWLAVRETGSASVSALGRHVEIHGAGGALQAAAVLVALAVIIRTALLPVHGWLIQVMEAPTPVSALLHAGVVNLGGYILIRFAPLFALATPAGVLLVGAGLLTAILAGFVMLTRISVKVRLAWSTLAQMGFMVMECGLGLYQLALLHLIGHSLYKAHAFLSAGEAVRNARLADMRGAEVPSTAGMAAAPVLSALLVASLTALFAMGEYPAWPWWWSATLALAWAPLLWTGASGAAGRSLLTGSLWVGGLTVSALLGHSLPFGVGLAPSGTGGLVALTGMVVMYLGTVALQVPSWSRRMERFRRQSYAGFYLDEAYTRLVLQFWPVRLPVGRPAWNEPAMVETSVYPITLKGRKS